MSRASRTPRVIRFLVIGLIILLATIFVFLASDTNAIKPQQAGNTQSVEDPIESLTNEGAKVSLNATTGVASFIDIGRTSINYAGSFERQATQFLAEYGAAFGITDAQTQLIQTNERRVGQSGSYIEYHQVSNRIPVFAGVLKIHFDADGNLFAANGTFIPKVPAEAVPKISPSEAETLAVSSAAGVDASLSSTALQVTDSRLLWYQDGLLQSISGDLFLAYEVEVNNAANTAREFIYVNANSGQIINRISGVHTDLDREISESSLANVVWDESNGDPIPIPGGWAGGTAQQVTDWNNEVDGAGETYHIFRSMADYDSYDDAGATMRTVNNDPGISCPNANWNGTSTNYCSNVTGDDTVAHEWGHAYTEYTNNLIYQWQSGALNESYSDIWGEVVDFLNGRGTDTPDVLRTGDVCSSNPAGNNLPGYPEVDTVRWLSGEDDPAFGGAIRDLWKPECFGDPGSTTSDSYFCSSADSGGVHTNSGVPNRAFALMVDGDSGLGITGLGLTKAAHIHWAAQNMLTPSSNFVDHADALVAACTALTGVNLNTLSTTDPSQTPSGEIITVADCDEVDEIIAEVQFYTFPDQCGFEPVLDPNAPALCTGLGDGTVNSIAIEDWESGSLPAGWSVGTRDVADPATFDTPDWAVVSTLPTGANGTYAAFVEDGLYGDCAADTEAGVLYLESPIYDIPAGPEIPRVAVDHWVATEAGWDGANIKYSLNGGSWTLLPASAYDFNPYNSTLNISDNPMGGEDAFTGSNGGTGGGNWGQSQINLFGIADPGDTIQFRFEMGLDGCNGDTGWYVDDVQLYSCNMDFPGANCGNSILDSGETCDDGNTDNGDGCSDVCLIEDGWTCTLPIPSNPDGTNVVVDGSFESGYPNIAWTPFSTFGGLPGFPICNTTDCADIANTGDWFVWIGGLSAGVTSSVTQTVTIPDTATELTMMTLRGICDDASDTLYVRLDGNDIGTFVCDGTDGGYVQQTLSIIGYNDNTEHELFIGGTVGGTNGTHTNFFVDDVIIWDNIPTDDTPSECVMPATGLTCNSSIGFEDGVIPSDWSITTNALPGGEWLVSTDNSSSFWDPGPAPEGMYYASANDDAPGSGSDGSADYLYTNIIDLSGYGRAELSFQYHFNGDFGQAAGGVQVSPDGGTTWDAEIIVPTGDDWQTYTLDLGAYAGNENVQIRFHADDGGNWAAGYAIDDVSLGCEIGPMIQINPTSVQTRQATDMQTQHTIDITNIGDEDLTWSIFEPADLPTLASHQPDAADIMSRGQQTDTTPPVADTFRGVTSLAEGFDDITNLPNWVMQNNSQSSGTTDWFQGNPAVFSAQAGAADAYIAANFNNTGSGTISNWLLTPELYLANDDTISFWTRTATGSAWPDRLEVRLSTNGDSADVGTSHTDVGDFTTELLIVNDSEATGGYPEVWTQYVITLTNIPTDTVTTGRIAFRYNVTDGGPAGSNSNYIGIDTVETSSDQVLPLCETTGDIPWVSLVPGSGTTAPSATDNVTLTFDSTGLADGDYTGTLCLTSNDGTNSPIQIPVTMTVAPFMTYLPIISIAPEDPDLVVNSIEAANGEISVVIENVGGGSVDTAFWVDLYVDPNSAPTAVNQTWDTVGNYGAAWGVSGAALPIMPGEVLTLTVNDAYFSSVNSNLPQTLSPGTVLYAQVDSLNSSTTYGNVLEGHELNGGTYNNITGPTPASAMILLTANHQPFSAAQRADLPDRQ